jgi:transposase
MNMKIELSEQERRELRLLQKSQKNKNSYVKITAVLMASDGYTYKQIHDVLGIDDATASQYISQYSEDRDVAKYLSDGRLGYMGRLSLEQTSELKAELSRSLYRRSRDVGEYIKQRWGIGYTNAGVVELLHRLEFVYKLSVPTPQSPPIEVQQACVKEMEQVLAVSKQADSQMVVVYMDGCHPHHNTSASYGWIAKGKEWRLPSNTSRERVNINAAINAHEPTDVTVLYEECLNAAATIRLYEKLERKYPDKTICVIRDNARYYSNKDVRAFLSKETCRIKELPLPPYSPNLNLIERLWKFMRQKIMGTTFYPTKAQFATAIENFFTGIENHARELSSLMTLRFHLIKPVT